MGESRYFAADFNFISIQVAVGHFATPLCMLLCTLSLNRWHEYNQKIPNFDVFFVCFSVYDEGGIKMKNPNIELMDQDILYHLALGNESHDLVEMFGDVKVSC